MLVGRWGAWTVVAGRVVGSDCVEGWSWWGLGGSGRGVGQGLAWIGLGWGGEDPGSCMRRMAVQV
jgi:hypothetical protein